jgi:PAS domain S-box-containing protein
MQTLDNFLDGVFLLDNNWNFTYLNNRAAAIIGLKPQDTVGKNLWKDFPQVKGTALEENYLLANRNQEIRHFETIGPGTSIWFEIIVYPSKEGIIVHWRDITERKKAEEALKESEWRLKMAQQVAHVGTFEWNIQTGVNKWTPELEAMYGIPTGSFPGTQDAWEQLVYPEDRNEAVRRVSEAIKNGSFEAEFRVTWSDGSVHWLLGRGWVFKDVTGKPLRLIGINIDISERKKAEEESAKATARMSREYAGLLELQELSLQLVNQENMQALLDNILKAGVKITHADMGTLQLYQENIDALSIVSNQGFDEAFISFFDSVNENTHSVCASAMKSKCRVIVSDVITSPIFVNTPALEIQMKAGVRAVQSTPLFTRTGKFLGILSTHYRRATQPEDIDLQLLDLLVRQASDFIDNMQNEQKLQNYSKNLEKMVEDKTKQLKDAERLVAIGATAGMVGHDIRNPLQAIVSDLYIARQEATDMPNGEAREGMVESLDSIEKNIFYINKIVSDLQDFAKALNPRSQETQIQPIVEAIMLNHKIPSNITKSMNIGSQAQTVMADPDFLKRIVDNLVLNAVQAMPEGGKLTIKATKDKQSGDVLFTVEDTGVGIPDDVKEKLFTPMFTTKSKGQGFGLAVVKRMAEALGGTVIFESEHGKGTKFIVRLPSPPKS